MKLMVRDETPADVAAIEAVTIEAFRDVVRSRHTEQYIVNALRRAGALAVSLVAERDGVIVGHVAVSPVAVSDGATGWHGLGPISVLPAYQRAGVGSALMHGAIEALMALDAQGCVLLGDSGYYRRFGFQPDPGLVLEGVPPQNFQALRLGSAMPHGSVTYHAAFAATS